MNLFRKVIDNFDFSKKYKLYRKLQKIVNKSRIKEYQDFNIELENRKLNIRVFNKNENTKNKEIIIYFHGGGWLSGSIESYSNILSKISKETNRIVITPDYRLAPEYKFPNGFNDCYDLTKLICNKIGSKRVILMGDSAGANLAAAVSQKLKDNFIYRIRKQILIYPALSGDYKENTKLKSVKEDKYLLSRKHLEQMLNSYINTEKDLKNPYVCPLKAKNLFFSPNTLIFTCSEDGLKDDGKLYYKKLKRYFNKTKLIHIERGYHGFLTNPLEKTLIKYTLDEINKFINK